ncbi:hypothetical protein PDJAM_G00088420 [Pangasius djambal]|uniref:Uncharacterized protein n=1 Tax=Pangasius djambal TaxID=1691987 RepID=A0ACC5Z4D1_9TELE|nr:hypothetical protein [Pangasius djambal]
MLAVFSSSCHCESLCCIQNLVRKVLSKEMVYFCEEPVAVTLHQSAEVLPLYRLHTLKRVFFLYKNEEVCLDVC